MGFKYFMTSEYFVKQIQLIPVLAEGQANIKLSFEALSIANKQYNAIASWLRFHQFKDYSQKLIIKYHHPEYKQYEVLAERILSALHLAEKIFMHIDYDFCPMMVIWQCELNEYKASIENLVCGEGMGKSRFIKANSDFYNQLENESVTLKPTTSHSVTYAQLEAVAQVLSKQNISGCGDALNNYCRIQKRLNQKLKKTKLDKVFLTPDLKPYVKENRGRISFDL
jgi:hypothetical protein